MFDGTEVQDMRLSPASMFLISFLLYGIHYTTVLYSQYTIIVALKRGIDALRHVPQISAIWAEIRIGMEVSRWLVQPVFCRAALYCCSILEGRVC